MIGLRFRASCEPCRNSQRRSWNYTIVVKNLYAIQVCHIAIVTDLGHAAPYPSSLVPILCKVRFVCLTLEALSSLGLKPPRLAPGASPKPKERAQGPAKAPKFFVGLVAPGTEHISIGGRKAGDTELAKLG